MRDLIYKNLTSSDKKTRKVSTCEIADEEGIRCTIRRHFVSVIKEVKEGSLTSKGQELFLHRERNTRQLSERFICKVKGSIYAKVGNKRFLVIYAHSLRIEVRPVPLCNRINSVE